MIACLQLPKAEIQPDRRHHDTFPLTRSALRTSLTSICGSAPAALSAPRLTHHAHASVSRRLSGSIFSDEWLPVTCFHEIVCGCAAKCPQGERRGWGGLKNSTRYQCGRFVTQWEETSDHCDRIISFLFKQGISVDASMSNVKA